MTRVPNDEQKESAALWFAELRDELCRALEGLEQTRESPGGTAPGPPPRFERTEWTHPGGGGRAQESASIARILHAVQNEGEGGG